jgi:hypothetical protein
MLTQFNIAWLLSLHSSNIKSTTETIQIKATRRFFKMSIYQENEVRLQLADIHIKLRRTWSICVTTSRSTIIVLLYRQELQSLRKQIFLTVRIKLCKSVLYIGRSASRLIGHWLTSHKEQNTIEASITLDGVTLTDALIRWSPNEWASVCREIPVSADKMF